MHDFLITGIQTLVILIGILMNRASIRGVRDEMNARFDAMDARFDKLSGTMDARFDKLSGAMDARFDAMDARLRACIDAARKRSS